MSGPTLDHKFVAAPRPDAHDWGVFSDPTCQFEYSGVCGKERSEHASPPATAGVDPLGLDVLRELVKAVKWALDGTDHLTDPKDPIGKAYRKAVALLGTVAPREEPSE